MSDRPPMTSRSGLNSTSSMSFAVALFAFAAAGAGVLVNHWMSGWMAVGGMAGVGLFYLAVGLLNLGSSEPIFIEDHDFTATATHRLSDATNVDDVAIERTSDIVVGSQNEKLANLRN